MTWLLWREYRLNRWVLIVTAVLVFFPYLVALIVFWWPTTRGILAPDVLFGGAAIYSLVSALLPVAFLGGNAMAGERADRSAEFMAYLPVSRTRRLGAKLTLALSVVTLIWGVNSLVLGTLVFIHPELIRQPEYPEYWEGVVIGLACIAITGLTFYGVGWLISSFQSSPTFAVGGGVITPLLLFIGLVAVGEEFGYQFEQFVVWWAMIVLPVGIVSFSVGTWYYLRRIEP